MTPSATASDRYSITWVMLLGMVAGAAALFFTVYGVIGVLQVGAELTTLESAIDRALPFSAPWVLCYGALYPVVVSPLFILTDRRVALRGALGLFTVVAAGVPFWLLFPVTVPRDPIEVHDVFTWGIVFIRHLDPPTNCFPSMHVAEAALSSLLVWRHDRRWGTIVLITTCGIWYSSIVIQQHWFVDGLAGVAIAVVVDRFVYRGLPRSAFTSKPRAWHLGWIALYCVLFALFASPWWFGWLDPAEVAVPWTSA